MTGEPGQMILWGLMDSPFTRRVAVAMRHYRFEFHRRPLSVFRDFDAMRAVSPLGRAPALTLPDGSVLTDSRTILEFLDEAAEPDRRLTPADEDARFETLQIEAVALGATEKAVEHSGERLRRAVPDVAQIGRLEVQIAAALDWLDRRAGAGPVAGDALGRADLALGCLSTYLAEKAPRLWGARRRLMAHRGWAEAQPCFAAAPFSLAEPSGDGPAGGGPAGGGPAAPDGQGTVDHREERP